MDVSEKIVVVYLARSGNDINLFKNFLTSYIYFPAGIEHDLLIVLKGFNSNYQIDLYKRIVGQLACNYFVIGDDGFDITAYIKVINTYKYDAYCFLNSNSIILAKNWLRILYSALNQEQVGLVGSTGSYQSMFRDQIGPGLRFMPKPKLQPIVGLVYAYYKWLLSCTYKTLSFIYRWFFFKYHFNKFPNPHIRTNGFMLSYEVAQMLSKISIRTKMDAWIFESGKKGLTSRVKRMGKHILIVGANGQSYNENAWPNSGIYKQAIQENLLISDNQTRVYEQGDIGVRKLHADYAWGTEDAANP